jgi:hypothetical protein
MNVAYLFDSDHSSLGFWYGGTVLQMILKTNVLQKSKRQMRVLVGDILTFSVGRRFGIQTYDDWAELTAAVLEPSGWSELNYKKLEGVLGQKTIYCWVFQNISLDLAKALWPAPDFVDRHLS